MLDFMRRFHRSPATGKKHLPKGAGVKIGFQISTEDVYVDINT